MPAINKPIIEIHNPRFAQIYKSALLVELKKFESKKAGLYDKILNAKEEEQKQNARRKYEILLDVIEEINLQINIIELNL